jgi:ketosteroid isomerase-like protein
MRLGRILLTCALPTLLLVGCGGGGSSPSASASSSTQSLTGFISQADAFCTAASASAAAVPRPTGVASIGNPSAGDLPALATYWGDAVTVFSAFDSQLKGLGTPPSKQTLWSQAITDLDGLVVDVQTLHVAAVAGDVNAYTTAYSKFQSDGSAANMAFTQFGFTKCGGGSTPSATPSPT